MRICLSHVGKDKLRGVNASGRVFYLREWRVHREETVHFTKLHIYDNTTAAVLYNYIIAVLLEN